MFSQNKEINKEYERNILDRDVQQQTNKLDRYCTFSLDSSFTSSGDLVTIGASVPLAVIGAFVVVVVVVLDTVSTVLLSSPKDPSSSFIFVISASSSPVAAIMTELKQARISIKKSINLN